MPNEQNVVRTQRSSMCVLRGKNFCSTAHHATVRLLVARLCCCQVVKCTELECREVIFCGDVMVSEMTN